MGRDFHAVMMDDIARRCGVGKGTLYRYFANKQELLYAVMRDGMLALLEQIRAESVSTVPPAEKLSAIVHAVLGHFAARPGLASIVDREESKRGVTQTKWFRRRAEVARLVADVIADGCARGVFRPIDPRLASEMLLGMIRALNRYRAPRMPIAQVSATVMSVFLAGIVAPDATAPQGVAGATTAPAPARGAARRGRAGTAARRRA